MKKYTNATADQQSEGEKEKHIAIEFRDWCIEKQQPYIRNGYQDLSTEELWNEFIKNK